MPTLIRVSYGTAIVLGLIKARQDIAPTTAYLLYDQGCVGSCTFCTRANGNLKSQNLSRIIWPEFELDRVIEELVKQPFRFERICLQTGFNPDPKAEAELKEIVKKLIKTGISTSMTLTPSQSEIALELLSHGLDHVGIGLDAATDKTYAAHKQRNWEKDWPALLDLISHARGKIEVHLIFGLGDTEEEFSRRIQELVDAGGKISLFAFTPVNGGLEPDISAYRRVQAFRYLCEKGAINFSSCRFERGRLVSFNMMKAKLEKLLDNGDAFRTSGCGSCNRPYYNEKPGKPFFNFPRPLYQPEFSKAIEQLELYF